MGWHRGRTTVFEEQDRKEIELIAEGRVLERAQELATIDALCGIAERGSGCALVIEGPAGIGKTELLSAARARGKSRGLEVLWAIGGELEREHPFGIVRQLFERRVFEAPEAERHALLSGAAQLAAPVLMDATPTIVSPEIGHAVLHGLYWLVANLAARPLLLVVDDAHWADAASASWIEYLVRRFEGMPILIALGLRSGEPATAPDILARLVVHPLVSGLSPRPLSEAAAGDLIGGALGVEPSAQFAAACHVATGGNPYLLRALADALREEDVAPTAANARRIGEVSPVTVERQVVVRLSRLGPDAGALAHAVAVLGARAELRRAAALAGLDGPTAGRAADLLADADILRHARPLEFVHPLVRAAVERTLAPTGASAAHRRAAELLAEDGQSPDEFAAHLIATDPAGDPWTVAQLQAAAQIARDRGALAGATRYLRRALEEPPVAEARPLLLLDLGSAEAVSAQPKALDHLTEAHRLLTDPSHRASAALLLSRVLFAADRLTDAVAVLQDAISQLGDTDRDLEAKLLSQAINAARNGLRHEIIEELMPQLENLATGRGLAQDAFLAHRSAQATITGEPAQLAGDLAERALASGRLRQKLLEGDVDYLLAARILILSERHEVAERHLREALELAQRSGTPVIAGMVLIFLSEIATRRGDPMPDADARLALEMPTEQGRLLLAPAAAFTIAALIERGELNEAVDLLHRQGIDGELPMAYSSSFLLFARGRLQMALGRPERALAELFELARREERMGGSDSAVWPWRSSAALALLELGDRERARALAQEEMELAQRFGARGAIGIALRALGIVEGGERGLPRLEDAVAVLEQSPAKLEYARALTDLGAALRRAGQVHRARDRLRLAMGLAHWSAATALEQRAHDELVASGARPRRPVLVGPEALTPSERRVAIMAAEGTSNRAIAEALFVTLRTVEIHLTHAYDKLGIQSRKGLVQALATTRGALPG